MGLVSCYLYMMLLEGRKRGEGGGGEILQDSGIDA